ncbi:hypothetical protein BjapCC829_23730 [Bradyrhizobium barranii]|uniref:Uncharacterized protein n=1 Tax=Bradyrhizobium barranii TaxID=2992140 RepID=A0ABY3QAT0_9BRAD|nr:hypothetical protein [Bradyrhizobium japonicum]UFW82999.1 hypothetical protein BjapCC829_23730 [Bradyrhizobium japonicum]
MTPLSASNSTSALGGVLCLPGADWLLQNGHGVDETTPAVENQKVDDEMPY